METIDHKSLGYILLNKKDSYNLTIYDKAFIFGCIEPDINFFTYMKGSIKFKKMFRGHQRINSLDYILRVIDKLSRKDYLFLIDYYKLGRVIHYIADSFTFPHTNEFKGDIKEHVIYERKLHQFLEENKLKLSSYKKSNEGNLKEYLLKMQYKYTQSKPRIENDLNYIINTCTTITRAILQHEYQYITISFIPKMN